MNSLPQAHRSSPGVAGRILTDNVRRLTYDAPFNWSAS